MCLDLSKLGIEFYYSILYLEKKQAKTLNLSGGISTTDDITTTPDDTTIIDEVSCVIIFSIFNIYVPGQKTQYIRLLGEYRKGLSCCRIQYG